MLLQIHEKLDELIVKALCHKANMTSKEIHQDVAERSGHMYTAQAVFKELTKLQSAGVVVRLKSRYSLMLSWTMRLNTLADVAKEVYLTKSPLDLIMAECEVKKTWRCSDFDKFANFWLQAKVALLRHTGGGALYEWQPHAWTELLYPERHRDLGGALRDYSLCCCRRNGSARSSANKSLEQIINSNFTQRWSLGEICTPVLFGRQ